MVLDENEAFVELHIVVVHKSEQNGIFVARPVLVEPRTRVFRAFCLKIVIDDGVLLLDLRFQVRISFSSFATRSPSHPARRAQQVNNPIASFMFSSLSCPGDNSTLQYRVGVL